MINTITSHQKGDLVVVIFSLSIGFKLSKNVRTVWFWIVLAWSNHQCHFRDFHIEMKEVLLEKDPTYRASFATCWQENLKAMVVADDDSRLCMIHQKPFGVGHVKKLEDQQPHMIKCTWGFVHVLSISLWHGNFQYSINGKSLDFFNWKLDTYWDRILGDDLELNLQFHPRIGSSSVMSS